MYTHSLCTAHKCSLVCSFAQSLTHRHSLLNGTYTFRTLFDLFRRDKAHLPLWIPDTYQIIHATNRPSYFCWTFLINGLNFIHTNHFGRSFLSLCSIEWWTCVFRCVQIFIEWTRLHTQNHLTTSGELAGKFSHIQNFRRSIEWNSHQKFKEKRKCITSQFVRVEKMMAEIMVLFPFDQKHEYFPRMQNQMDLYSSARSAHQKLWW